MALHQRLALRGFFQLRKFAGAVVPIREHFQKGIQSPRSFSRKRRAPRGGSSLAFVTALQLLPPRQRAVLTVPLVTADS
jgi:hypothetical protein